MKIFTKFNEKFNIRKANFKLKEEYVKYHAASIRRRRCHAKLVQQIYILHKDVAQINVICDQFGIFPLRLELQEQRGICVNKKAI